MIENPYLFACEWYRPEAIFAAMNRYRNEFHNSDKYANIPADVTSFEFAAWLTEEYRLAMAKGIELGKRDAEAAEREACAALMESDVRGARRVNPFCRLADHMQNLCECEERADAIRARLSHAGMLVVTNESVKG